MKNIDVKARPFYGYFQVKAENTAADFTKYICILRFSDASPNYSKMRLLIQSKTDVKVFSLLQSKQWPIKL